MWCIQRRLQHSPKNSCMYISTVQTQGGMFHLWVLKKWIHLSGWNLRQRQICFFVISSASYKTTLDLSVSLVGYNLLAIDRYSSLDMLSKSVFFFLWKRILSTEVLAFQGERAVALENTALRMALVLTSKDIARYTWFYSPLHFVTLKSKM